MARRGVIVSVVAWVAVVLLGSSMVWAVISRAGQEVVTVGDPANATAGPATLPGPTLSQKARPSDKPSKSSKPGKPGSSSSSEPDQSPGSSSTGSVASSQAPTSNQSPSPSNPPASSPPPPVKRGSWSGPGGSVSAGCRGTTLADVAAIPAAGFKVDEVEKGAHEATVKFLETGDGGREVEVHVTCSGGTPHFSAESHDTGDDGAEEEH
jgi:hypothetical protein